MASKKPLLPPADNLKWLMLHVLHKLDRRIIELRAQTPYADAPPFDVTVFALASRQPASIQSVAEFLGLPPDDLRPSIARLEAMGVLRVEPDGNHENLILTEAGFDASEFAMNTIGFLEAEIGAAIGVNQRETFRATLMAIDERMN